MSLMHFEFIFVQGERLNSFSLVHMDSQFF
jgi:hypothetical protein